MTNGVMTNGALANGVLANGVRANRVLRAGMLSAVLRGGVLGSVKVPLRYRSPGRPVLGRQTLVDPACAGRTSRTCWHSAPPA